MRTYGRIYATDGSYKWVVIETDVNGNNDAVWTTTLIQALKLALGEAPFFANYGIPAQQSVLQQIFPDFYVAQTQAQFAQYFASLIVAKVNDPTPTYTVNALANNGATISAKVPV